MRRRVVVTGMGAVTPIGQTVEDMWKALREGQSGIGLISHFDASHFPTKFAAEVKDFDLGKYGRLTPEFITLYSSSYLLSNSLPNFRQTPYFKTDARITWLSPNGRLTVQGFVENLEDVATIDRVTTSSLAVSGTYSDPRTYGIKVGFRY